MRHLKLFEDMDPKPGDNGIESTLQLKIKNDLQGLRMDGQSPSDDVRIDGDSLSVDFRDLGNWVHDEENAWDREEDDPDFREDDDQMIWAPGEYKRYLAKFEDWAKSKDWYPKVKLSLETSEKNWVSFNINIIKYK